MSERLMTISVRGCSRAEAMEKIEAALDRIMTDAMRKYITDILAAPEIAECDVDIEALIADAAAQNARARLEALATCLRYLDEGIGHDDDGRRIH